MTYDWRDESRAGVTAALGSANGHQELSFHCLLDLDPDLADELEPDSYGGAMLLGVDGVCIISHGSSSARAIVNAVRVAHDMAAHDVVARLRSAVSS